jgi:S-adenosylmethionine synthetase
VSYGIGLPEPISINIDCFGTNKKSLEEIEKFVTDNFDFSVGNIIKELDLLKPIYKATACYGHFGREEFSWEKIKQLK